MCTMYVRIMCERKNQLCNIVASSEEARLSVVRKLKPRQNTISPALTSTRALQNPRKPSLFPPRPSRLHQHLHKMSRLRVRRPLQMRRLLQRYDADIDICEELHLQMQLPASNAVSREIDVAVGALKCAGQGSCGRQGCEHEGRCRCEGCCGGMMQT